jgi:RNA polymerase sigma-70 factor (ECF subfamily)
MVWREQSAGDPGADQQVFAGQIGKRLEQALDRLSPRQRAVFTLRHFENKDLDEIAEILAIDKGSVKSHMFRAIGKLREELKDLYKAE